MGIAHGRTEGTRYAIVDENVPTEYDQYVIYNDANATFYTTEDILNATQFEKREDAIECMKEYILHCGNKPGVMLVTVFINADFEHESGHW